MNVTAVGAVFCVMNFPEALLKSGREFFIIWGCSMKHKTRIFFALCLSLVCALCLFACGDTSNGEGKLVCRLVENTTARVVICVEETDGETTLLDCMEQLKASETQFSYKLVSGMVTAINGVENPADFSKCWMLYTSDAEMANAAWGTAEYDGKTLGSAVVGADALDVIAGGIYIWDYVSF